MTRVQFLKSTAMHTTNFRVLNTDLYQGTKNKRKILLDIGYYWEPRSRSLNLNMLSGDFTQNLLDLLSLDNRSFSFYHEFNAKFPCFLLAVHRILYKDLLNLQINKRPRSMQDHAWSRCPLYCISEKNLEINNLVKTNLRQVAQFEYLCEE